MIRLKFNLLWINSSPNRSFSFRIFFTSSHASFFPFTVGKFLDDFNFFRIFFLSFLAVKDKSAMVSLIALIVSHGLAGPTPTLDGTISAWNFWSKINLQTNHVPGINLDLYGTSFMWGPMRPVGWSDRTREIQ